MNDKASAGAGQPSEGGPGGRFNLSEWALRHRSMVLYLMLVCSLMGIFSYSRLGQSEDPPFTFKVMVVRAEWPGASALDMELQVTDKIERKLQELPLDSIRSYSKPGEALVFVALKDSLPSSVVPDYWYQVRKKVGDIKGRLPAGVRGPYFNDEFGDTYTSIYALTADGFGYKDLKAFGDHVREELLRVPGVAKVDFLGEQEEKIFVEASNAKLATLGIEPAQIYQTIANQNAITAAGSFETGTDRIYLRTSGSFGSLDAIRDLSIRANDRIFRLGDIATVRRDYVDPPEQKMRYEGHEALGVAVTMVKGGDVIELGRGVDKVIARVGPQLPVGVEIHPVASMPRAVQRSINDFVESLTEAVLIVLAVSLVSLGLRTGLVVAIAIPLVLAMTFFLMNVFDIGLHKISLGALILSLGLLVDDAIIAVEMMVIKMEEGLDRFHAASFAYTSTAFPMLTGTLVTVAGFLPIATAQSATGEYTRSLFQVSAIALIVSWVVAVVVIPYLGFRLLPDFHAPQKPPAAWQAWLAQRRAGLLALLGVRPAAPGAATGSGEDSGEGQAVRGHDVYDTVFYRSFRRLIDWNVAHRKTVIGATLLAFAGAMVLFGIVPQQFFPSSSRPELMVDLRLPEGSAFAASLEQVKKFEAILQKEPGIENYVAYVGAGSPRFYLPLDQQLQQANFSQFVVVAKNNHERERLRERFIHLFEEDFPALRGRVTRLENGPPVGFPVQFRVSGEDIAKVKAIARQVLTVMRTNPHLSNVQLDWDEPAKLIRLEVDQNKARVLGVSSQDLASFVNNAVSGSSVTSYREADKQIDIVVRGAPEERARLSFIKDIAIPSRNGKAVPITQIATVHYELEEGIVWRRDRLPTVTVRGDTRGEAQGPDVTGQVDPLLDPIRATLPFGYHIDVGGAIEDSAKGQKSIAAGVPLLALAVLTLLMMQLQSFSRTLLVVLTAPLGLIGVVIGLLLFGKPFGFVAMLGTIALSGIIMRNSVILVDQIEQDIAAGIPRWDAVVGATVRRFRPIVLTAAAAVLALIPLTGSDFFGPMAVAMMGGILVATVLTLGFLPALYALWFRVRPQERHALPLCATV